MWVDSLIERSRRIPAYAADALLAGLVALVTIIAVVVESQTDDTPLTLYGSVLLGFQLVPVVWRRRRPLPVLAVVGIATLLYGMAELPDPPVMFALLLAIYTVASLLPRSVGITCAVVMMVAGAIGIWFGDASDAADVAVNYFTGTAAWFLGDATRTQRERARRTDDERAREAEDAVNQERMRIARDMHDIVGHHISVIAVQAEAAQEVLAVSPEKAAAAMANVSETARTALDELRRAVGVVKDNVRYDRAHTLDDLELLVERVRQTGRPVTLSMSGEIERRSEMDAIVQLSAYRIAQEALTNVIKHAGSNEATVHLRFTSSDVFLTIIDCGQTPQGRWRRGRGVGMTTMRQRAELVGGFFWHNPTADGFKVLAVLPYKAGGEAQ